VRAFWTAILGSAVLWGQSVAEPVNNELPRWLRFGGEYRMRLEGFAGGGFRGGNDDAYALNRIRLNLTVQPLEWLRFVFQAQDARVWGNDVVPSAPPYKDSMDLRVGYLELGDADSQRPASLRAGRQELVFGEQRLVGHTSWGNTARTFDGVRATFRVRKVRLDAWASSVVVIRNGEFNRPVTGDNFHGLYASTKDYVPAGTVEAYLLWRVAPGLDFKTIGTRWAGKLPARFDYGVEMALQTGSRQARDVRAWAGHWILGYTMNAPWKPRLLGEYNYASGDRDPGDRRFGTFDSLYPTPHGKYGVADQVGWRNIHDLRLGVETKPRPKWAVNANLHTWWLASARDALYNAQGAAIARSADGTAGRHIGWELDFDALYTLSKQVQVGAGMGHLFPGEFLKKTTPGHAYTYPYVMLNYSF
jgi:hypothetical protein